MAEIPEKDLGFNHLSGGLAAFQLSVNTLVHLEKYGLLTPAATNEIIEQALLALETIQAKASPKDQSVVEGARILLERLRRRSPLRPPSRS
jgi:hypothetical protein